MNRLLLLILAAVPALLVASPDQLPLNLSTQEKAEIQGRLDRFRAASNDDPTPMFYRPLKYSVGKRAFIHPNASLALPPSSRPRNPILELAGKKLSPEFQRLECEKVFKKHFPKMNCEKHLSLSRSTVETEGELDDRFTNLTDGWIPRDRLILGLDDIPVNGETALPLWSDDYWKTQWGVTSYRYADDEEYETYETAVAAYKQPDEWATLFGSLSIEELASKIISWSPAEKYDLAVGDEKFTLTNEQKGEGKGEMKEGKVESWIGICHGWVNASIMTPRPMKPVIARGAEGVSVTFYPADVRALLSLSWANGNEVDNFAGRRCAAKAPRTFPNGRLAEQKCFDTNPATLHMALGNLIGRARLGFIMDKTFDYEIWNQPIAAYELAYFNPLDTSRFSKDWKDVAIDYDETFKAVDRFQHPLTRGMRSGNSWDDSRVKKIVGVIANVTYLSENDPLASESPDSDPRTRETYMYDLELEAKAGALIPTGGEWYQLSHPDFLWMPARDALAGDEYEDKELQYSLTAGPSNTVTANAAKTSPDGFPLCHVMKELVRVSADSDAYRCDPSDPLFVLPKPGPIAPPSQPVEDCHSKPWAPAHLLMTVSNLTTRLDVDGHPMGDFQATGSSRRFDSPPFDPCESYHYTLTVSRWKLERGSWIWATDQVIVHMKTGKTSFVTVGYDGTISVNDVGAG